MFAVSLHPFNRSPNAITSTSISPAIFTPIFFKIMPHAQVVAHFMSNNLKKSPNKFKLKTAIEFQKY